MISTVAVATIVLLAIFTLLIFAASYGDLSNRIDALAESQSLLSESQSFLSQSQVDLASAVESMAPLVDNLVAEREAMQAEIELLTKAVQQQAVTALKHQLISACAGDRRAARRQYELERAADPGKNDEWYFKQAIRSLTSSPPTASHG